MRTEDFTENAAVEVRLQPTGYAAALPKPIPPVIEPSWQLVAALSQADRSLSELAGAARNLPNPHLLIRPFMRKEAVLSSKIEGTQASLSDLLIFEASDEKEERTSDVREVKNYISALEYGLKTLDEFPLSLRFLRDMHRLLMDDPTKTPGEFRTSQNWIGPAGCSLNEASYVPPPPSELMDQLGTFEKFLHAPGSLPPILKYAIAHYQFEAIHPFLDGNGRLGRLLITLLLCADPCLEQPILPLPLLYLSAFFERHRDEYYSHLNDVSKHGRWDEWFHFFLKGVAEQSQDALARSDRLVSLNHLHRQSLRSARGSALTLTIADYLLTSPIISVTEVANMSKRTYAGAQNAVKRLEDLGILQVIPGTSYPKLYVAREILDILE